MRTACHCQKPKTGAVLGVLFAFLIVALRPVPAQAGPETDIPIDQPPSGILPVLVERQNSARQTGSNPLSPVEWSFHKTADGAHPSAMEQQILWLMNRARTNPAAEADWLSVTTEADIARAREFFKIDLRMLSGEFTRYAVKPPAAFDSRLYQAALAHSINLIRRNSQDHVGQYERVVENGFLCDGGSGYFFRGNVFAFAENGLNTHAAWNIDWGGPNGGMQVDRGHRMGVMSADGNLTNAGIAMVYEDDPETIVGPFVATANYCHSAEAKNQHNRFLIGTVWTDMNFNRAYDPGEGIGGVRVQPEGADFYAITSESGGYAVPITRTGRYRVAFSGGVNGMRVVSIHHESVLLDFVQEMPAGSDQNQPALRAGGYIQPIVTR